MEASAVLYLLGFGRLERALLGAALWYVRVTHAPTTDH
jgi:hypothetical protein